MNISPQDFVNRIYDKESLPKGLIVKGGVTMAGCKNLSNLPENLTIEGHLSIRHCTNLTHLPSGLVIHGWLDIRNCTSLNSIPPDLIIVDTYPYAWAKLIFCDEDLINRIPQEDLPLYINFNYEDSIREYLTSRLHKKTTK